MFVCARVAEALDGDEAFVPPYDAAAACSCMDTSPPHRFHLCSCAALRITGLVGKRRATRRHKLPLARMSAQTLSSSFTPPS